MEQTKTRTLMVDVARTPCLPSLPAAGPALAPPHRHLSVLVRKTFYLGLQPVVPEDSIGDLRRALHITDEDSDTTCWRLVDASESVVKDPASALRVRWQSSGHWHECCHHHCVSASESKYLLCFAFSVWARASLRFGLGNAGN